MYYEVKSGLDNIASSIAKLADAAKIAANAYAASVNKADKQYVINVNIDGNTNEINVADRVAAAIKAATDKGQK